MNGQVREFLTKVEAIGWRFDGYLGSDHVRVVHDDGHRATLPATPSEYRSLLNSLATLERLCGQKLPRVNHRRSRKPTRTAADPEVEASRRRHADESEQKQAAKAKRDAEIRATEASERRRREIEELMR